ncbi:MAG: glycosyltransferase family 4 protein [Candidatus Harrisonbacteria bacterium]|nr:glycosyltransferase family 4 protein [Candidatus Harrisonbacteria bacterium]
MYREKSNIAVFSLAFTPFEGGAEIAAREIIARLKGLNFTILTHKFDRNWLSRESGDNYEIVRLGKGRIGGKKYGRIWDKIAYAISAWRKAEELHAQKRFEAIWAIMASYGGVAALFFKLNHPRVPLLLTIQEGDSEKHLVFGKLGLVGLFGKLLIRRADYIQVISNYLKEFARRRGARCPIEVIPNGVDLDLFGTNYKNSEIKAVRENLSIKDDYVIVTTSRLVYKNGVDILVRAVALFKEKRPNVKCLIIGDGPERRALELKAKSLKLEANVIFLGQIPQRDLPLYLKIADIFVRPSRSEGLGSSFLEAMAASLPVIGTPVGGIVDFLIDPSVNQEEATGFFVKVDDPQDLSEKMNYLLSNIELRKKVARRAGQSVRENYSWDRISRLFKNIFDRLINL